MKRQSRVIAHWMVVGAIALFAGSCGPSAQDAPSAEDNDRGKPFGGTEIQADWLDGYPYVQDAEKLFWATFQNQTYKDINTLFDFLTLGLAEAQKGSNLFAEALMYGRLGWTYLWAASEYEYAKSDQTRPLKKEVQDVTLLVPGPPREPVDIMKVNQKHFEDAKKLVSPSHPERVTPPQIASYYFGKATDLIMDLEHNPAYQKQNWTTAKIPGTEESMPDWTSTVPNGVFGLAWRTFPAVVTGFDAAFGGITMEQTEESVSYSLGFNFATHVFGVDVPGHKLGAEDVREMWKMMHLAADPRVLGVTVFGSPKDLLEDSYVQKQDALYLDFYTHVTDKTGYEPPNTDVADFWNAERTPTDIVKASCGSSPVIPFLYENNFRVLGDSMFATYHEQGSKGPTGWLKAVHLAYTYAQGWDGKTGAPSPRFEEWPYKESINNRLKLLAAASEKKATPDEVKAYYKTLLELAQNERLPGNPLHHASCMTCHKRPTEGK